ncbi:MAG: bifunctional diguanylate cyclase/phosphodiesterase [Pseudomonadota bacterium]
MNWREPNGWTKLLERGKAILHGPQMLTLVPAVTLGAFWLGGEFALLTAALLLPILWVASGGSLSNFSIRTHVLAKGLVTPELFDETVETTRTTAHAARKASMVMAVELDDFNTLRDRFEPAAADRILTVIGDRIIAVLRDLDTVSRIGDCRFGICAQPVVHIDLESCIQMASRIQETIEEPIALDGTTVYVTACVGFCMLGRAPGTNGKSWVNASIVALTEAQKRGPGSVRAYSAELQNLLKRRADMREEVVVALEQGQIQPWYQPQISTDTGRVTGFEALARWMHPDRGPVAPAEFLPAIEDAGQLERLAEVMIYHTLSALKAWDTAGICVPQVGVNFSGCELGNPKLIDKLCWELDRFDLTPDRLSVEILETVVTQRADDTIVRNIRALADLGCQIDLDDFGTGHASIASLKRFGVHRIKIDRSFVMKADRDVEQQRMISAILTMAERLGIETLAEGVETVGEHALLAQLGCTHVQGFGIARPMPFEKTMDWVRMHEAKLQEAPPLPGRQTG